MSKAFRSARTGHADLKLLARWEKQQAAKRRHEMGDIVKRLRAQVHDIWEAEDLRLEAADRIAALEAEVARLRAALQQISNHRGIDDYDHAKIATAALK
jgi:hypothetical protein